MGNTGILFAAIKSGSIDLYPDYTGTVARELPQVRGVGPGIAQPWAPIARAGVAVPLGFEDTYALAMLDSEAKRLGVKKHQRPGRTPAAALRSVTRVPQPQRRLAGTGPHLRSAAGAERARPRPGLRGALAARQIDVMDIYSTDAKIAKYKLRVLLDDRHFFPEYAAVLVYRLDMPQRFPQAWAALQKLQGRVSADQMVAMNAEAELNGKGFGEIAASFLASAGSAQTGGGGKASFWSLLFGNDFWRLTRQHLVLVFASLAAAVAVGIPFGVWAARSTAAAQPILSIVGVIQTVPSLALFAFLIPVLGMIGTWPALVALFLYSLLPIVRNTYSGLADIARPLRESARALGLPAGARLRLVELPLAARSILGGIKTSAVINVGTATIAAFIGAGGYGERITTGLALNDNAMLLAGAVPAAALALLVHALFELLDRWLIPVGLR
mgnify:CR=1 FL=1